MSGQVRLGESGGTISSRLLVPGSITFLLVVMNFLHFYGRSSPRRLAYAVIVVAPLAVTALSLLLSALVF